MQLLNPLISHVEAAIENKKVNCRDKAISCRDINANIENEVLSFRDVSDIAQEQVQFSESALTQILNKVQIPVLFWKRCNTFLQKENFQFFNERYNAPYFFRFDEAHGKNHVRAVLSDRYSVVDDSNIFPVVFDVLKNRNDILLRVFNVDDKITQLLIEFTDTMRGYDGLNYCAGLSITNSETGHSSVWVEPVVHTPALSYFNRYSLAPQNVDCRMIHRGTLAPERLGPMVEEAKKIAQVGMVQLAEAQRVSMSKKSVFTMMENAEMPSRFQAILEEEWQNEQTIIKAEAARRIIMFAQTLPLFQKCQLEQAAGKMLGLFEDYQNRFSDLAREINTNQER